MIAVDSAGDHVSGGVDVDDVHIAQRIDIHSLLNHNGVGTVRCTLIGMADAVEGIDVILEPAIVTY